MMQRNHFVMPSLHSALCSLEWMHGVQEGVFYCLKTDDINANKRCFSRPTKKILLEKLDATLRPAMAATDDRVLAQKMVNLLDVMET